MTTTHALLAPARSRAAVRDVPLRARIARQLVLRRLAKVSAGSLTLRDETTQATHVFGREVPHELSATLRVLDPSFWTAMVAKGSIGVAEAWMDGAWTCDDLTSLVRTMLRNRGVLDGMEGGLARLSAPLLRLFHARNGNTPTGSRRNIAAHYDLGNDFFELFLDQTLSYSAGIFESPDATMAEASIAKIDRLCKKLDLRSSDRLLEIGTGWGALAIHAAREYGCHVTTTTISREQFEGARARIDAAGLSDRIDLRLSDYRDLAGRFDKLVHCEMIEAVGSHFLPQFMAKCQELLEPHGVLAMQAITIQDQHYARALREVDFIKRYIFPGSFIPSNAAMLGAVARSSDLRLTHLEDIGPSYALTLRAWRERFHAALPQARQLGYSEAFIRMWNYYFCYCEGGFLERSIGDVHLLLSKPGNRRNQYLPDLQPSL